MRSRSRHEPRSKPRDRECITCGKQIFGRERECYACQGNRPILELADRYSMGTKRICTRCVSGKDACQMPDCAESKLRGHGTINTVLSTAPKARSVGTSAD